MELTKSGYNLIVEDLSTSQTSTGHWHFFVVANRAFEEIRFADGTIWDKATISSVAYYAATNGADTITGTSTGNRLIGLAGDDTLTGMAGADTFVFADGDGSDTITDFSVANADLIDVSAYGFTSNQDFNGFTFDGSDTIVDFNSTDQVTVASIDLTTQTSPDDAFIFA